MKYYKEIEIDEHLLYSKEIAKMLGVYTTKGTPHATLVKNALEIVRLLNDHDKIFFKAKAGMGQVYPVSYIEHAVEIINSKSKYVCDIGCNHYKHKDKNYYFVIIKEDK